MRPATNAKQIKTDHFYELENLRVENASGGALAMHDMDNWGKQVGGCSRTEMIFNAHRIGQDVVSLLKLSSSVPATRP